MTILVGGLLALFAVAPYLALQGSVRRRYALFDVASFAAAALAIAVAPHFAVSTGAILVAFFVAKFVGFHGFLAAGEGESRWTANAAALFAFVVYLLLVPHVLQWVIDGDEPYYVLVTESIVHDGDLDLSNQYRDLAQSATRRLDLEPQFGDPAGAKGEQYSRLEPLLPIALIPGYLIAGLAGCIATIALFGGLLVRSTMRLLEEEGFRDRSRKLIAPLLSFGPPVIFYADRIWPEVPAAWLFAEMLRGGLRVSRDASSRGAWIRLGLAGVALSLLKIRFLPIAVLLVVIAILMGRKKGSRVFPAAIALAVAVVPMLVLQLVAGSPINIHEVSEIAPQHPEAYLRGMFGSLLDAERGMLFRAPLWLLSLWALARWKETPASFRLGALASSAYLLLLFPRAEWDGGWSPPLRYLVVFAPLFTVAIAFAVERMQRWSLFAVAVLMTIANSVLAVVAPWRLFHIANGESAAGEWLSRIYRTDFSRLLPSFIRPNCSAIVFSIVVLAAFLLAIALRGKRVVLADPIVAAALAIVLAAGLIAGREPGSIVHLEDAHVSHHGGELYPELWTVGRFMYQGGWTLHAGQWVSFLDRGGPSRLWYMSKDGATLDLNGRAVVLSPSGGGWHSVDLDAGPRGVARLKVRSGSATIDRIEHE